MITTQRQCTYWFPDTFKAPTTPRVDATNAAYAGWNVSVDRLFFANGRRELSSPNKLQLLINSEDPWRDATVSSEFVTSLSTDQQPIALSDGFHCSDLLASSGLVDPTILAVQRQALDTMRIWLSSYEPANIVERASK